MNVGVPIRPNYYLIIFTAKVKLEQNPIKFLCVNGICRSNYIQFELGVMLFKISE